MSVQLQSLITCDMARRGDGKETPVRVILEVYTTDGVKIADYDPNSFTIEQIIKVSDGMAPGSTQKDLVERLKHGIF